MAMDDFNSFKNEEIPAEANIAVRQLLGEDEARLARLLAAPSLQEMHALSKELIPDADERLARSGVGVAIGKRALNNVLVRLWMAEHPTEK